MSETFPTTIEENALGTGVEGFGRTKRRAGRRSVLRAIVMGFLLLLAVAFDFRLQIGSAFSILNGDRFDATIQISILEHWYSVLNGYDTWKTTQYFYPYTGVLGYNDGYFIYGIIYSIIRYSGFDPYLSSEFVNISLRYFGFVSFYLLARRVLGLSFGWSAFGAVLFSINGTLTQHSGHEQLLSVGFAPLLAVLVRQSLAGLMEGSAKRFVGWGMASAALLGAWLMTAYYMAWFTLFFGLFFFAALFELVAGEVRRTFFNSLRRHWRAASLVILSTAVALLPFGVLYLPKAESTGMWSFAVPAYYALTPLDIVHVGDGNLIWGAVDRWLNAAFRPTLPNFSEHTVGFAPILLLVFLYGVWLARRRAKVDLSPSTAIAAAAVATIASWVFFFRIGDFVPWYLIHSLVPGAKGLRTISRYQLFLAVPVVAIVTATLSRVSARIPKCALLLICGALLVEETGDYQPGIDRAAETALLRSIPPPPSECRAFFTSMAREGVTGTPRSNAIYSHNVDAMMISEILHLPTINGFSTFNPPDWAFIDDDHAAYLLRVREYASAHRIEGLCGLDLRKFEWNAHPFS